MTNVGTSRRIRCMLAGTATLALLSGCANQRFQTTGGTTLSPAAMQHMVLRAKYPKDIAAKIPLPTREAYEEGFLAVTNVSARVVGKDDGTKPEVPFYYLETEVTKYKPGSPGLRGVMTPIIAFGLWGSYVNVDFSVRDPATDTVLGKGVIRKANLWGGAVGRSTTSETQLMGCPKEIMSDLENSTQRKGSNP